MLWLLQKYYQQSDEYANTKTSCKLLDELWPEHKQNTEDILLHYIIVEIKTSDQINENFS